MLQLVKAELTARQTLSSINERLIFDCPDIAGAAEPGQFVMVQCAAGSDPFLRRALSVSDVAGDAVSLVVQDVGPGTHLMRAFEEGAPVSLLGPLGKGFDTDLNNAHVLIIAGGVGIAPFPFLIKALAEGRNRVTVLAGGRNRDAVTDLDTLFEGLDVSFQVVTEDGSLGQKGLVTDHLPDLATVDRIYTCGPNPMLAAVKRIADGAGVPCQLSLEGKMACGVGVCLGCTCKGKTDEEPYLKVCTDGPVFWSEEVRLS